MLGRAALYASKRRTHAYLVLLPVEVAAFHPAALICHQIMRHGVTMAVWALAHPRVRLVSVALFLSLFPLA